MNPFFNNMLPESPSAILDTLYSGTVYLLPPTEATESLVDAVWTEIKRELEMTEETDCRNAHAVYQPDELFQRIGRLRKQIYTRPEFHRRVDQVIETAGFPLEAIRYDPARLRTVQHNGHLNPAAAPIYYGHRDTWYANPQSMITWWIPLHEIEESFSFDFWPDAFDRVVENDSEIFDFDTWVSRGQEKRIGWQNQKTGLTAAYPQLRQPVESISGPVLPVLAQRAELLLFSGQHLHKTRLNESGTTRFSLDFRTVQMNDFQVGGGARNVDNRSTGSSIVQFVQPNR